MKIVIAVLAVLALTTGFTCSKNPPAETQGQEQMAAPATTETTMPPAAPDAVPAPDAPAGEAPPANH